MLLYLYGAVSLGFACIGLFFFKFWRTTRDSLFGAFAVSSWILGLVQSLLAIKLAPQEDTWVYLLRLVAFVIIAAAILAKNLER